MNFNRISLVSIREDGSSSEDDASPTAWQGTRPTTPSSRETSLTRPGKGEGGRADLVELDLREDVREELERREEARRARDERDAQRDQ